MFRRFGWRGRRTRPRALRACPLALARIRAQAHARQLPHIFRRKLPILTLGRELDEGAMQGAAGGSNHLGVVVVADAEADRHLKAHGTALDLKRDADRPAAGGSLDACHLDLDFLLAPTSTAH